MPKRPVGNPNAGFGGSAAPSTVGDFDADDFSMAETGAFAGSEANYIQRQPDFRSMLEAALRGDLV